MSETLAIFWPTLLYEEYKMTLDSLLWNYLSWKSAERSV